MRLEIALFIEDHNETSVGSTESEQVYLLSQLEFYEIDIFTVFLNRKKNKKSYHIL